MDTTVIRQGDVLLRPIPDLPENVTELPVSEREGVVLARGERHGHRHMLPYGGAVLYLNNDTGSRVLDVRSQTVLQQFGLDDKPTGDHATLDVPAGKYEVVNQQAAQGEKAVMVSD